MSWQRPLVILVSGASNLVGDDTSPAIDVFRHDFQAGTTVRASLASDGSEGNGDSGFASVSDDGRYVAFTSLATNLVTPDTNGQKDVFVRDLQAGKASSPGENGLRLRVRSAMPGLPT